MFLMRSGSPAVSLSEFCCLTGFGQGLGLLESGIGSSASSVDTGEPYFKGWGLRFLLPVRTLWCEPGESRQPMYAAAQKSRNLREHVDRSVREEQMVRLLEAFTLLEGAGDLVSRL